MTSPVAEHECWSRTEIDGCRIWVSDQGELRCSGTMPKIEPGQIPRLVYMAHAGPIPPGTMIHHVNGDENDNRLVNLRAVEVEDMIR